MFLFTAGYTNAQMLDNTANSKSLDWETAMFVYSVDERGIYSGLQYSWNERHSLFLAPMLISDEANVRLGLKIASRTEAVCGPRDNSKAYAELGAQYFEIRGPTKHYTQTLLVTEGIGLILPIGKNEFSFYFGGGIDLGNAFVTGDQIFTGIARISWQFADIIKF